MRKTQNAPKLTSALLLTFFALRGASPSTPGAQELRQCDLADASSLLQQHAAATVVSHLPSSVTASAGSNASLMASFKELEKEAETYKLEDALRLYETGQRLANLSHVSLEEKGLMLLQEASRISKGQSPFDPVWEWLDEKKKKLLEWLDEKKKESKKSEMLACWGSRLQIPFNLLGALFSIFVTVTCDSVGSCTSEGIETVRYLLVTMQHWQGRKSYCAKTFKMDYLCQAAVLELGSNLGGLSGAITGLTYKCPEYAVDVDKKVIGLKVTAIQCNLGYAKGAVYLAVAISKIAEIYANWGENTANKEVSQTQGAITFYTGAPYSSFFSQLSATMAWIAQLVLLMVGNCKGQAGKMACNGEIAELVAFISQSFTGGAMVNSYCFDPDNRKAVLEKATDVTHMGARDSIDLTRAKSVPPTKTQNQPLSVSTGGNSKVITKALSLPMPTNDDEGA